MCFMSVVHDYHKKLEPDYWTPKKFDYFRDLLKDAERYDEQTGQKDCLDPKKAEFLKDVEKLLEEKYGIAKKFDWEVGDSVCTLKSKLVISKKTFDADITLRGGLVGRIVEIEHEKTKVIVRVVFEALPQQKVEFYFDIKTIDTQEELRNNSSVDRRNGFFSSFGGGGGTSQITLNHPII